MKIKFFVIGSLLVLLSACAPNPKQTTESFATIQLAPELGDQFQSNGRLYVIITDNFRGEPYYQTWPSPGGNTFIFAKNMEQLDLTNGFELTLDSTWNSSCSCTLDSVPEGEYNVQVLWDQDTSESRINAPGNLYSLAQKVTFNMSGPLEFTMDEVIPVRALENHQLAREVSLKSELLSDWWDKPMYLKAAVLLPHKYDSTKVYPIRYNVAGYGGRYTRMNRLLDYEDFMNWWDSEEAPQIINVYLDGEGPFGDSYQMDSENSGPYGESLIKELIPFIESNYRGTDDASTRFVDGCSTGGWVSLGLQLYYPDTFNGVFSYSPDAIEFENYQLINIYKDSNAFVNEFGYERPVMRSTLGEPMLALKDFIQYENVLGDSDSYLNSGGQFSAHTALYSPKGDNGLPKPLIDPETGAIDASVAEHWKKYDFKIHAQENWETLGPKLQGKIYVWMGDMDHFYLNMATRAFSDFLDETQNPKSDAVIEFTPMEGHCTQYSDRKVLLQIQERLKKLGKI